MMSRKLLILLLLVTVLLVILTDHCSFAMDAETRKEMKLKVLDMFKHAYGAYMEYAFPADELMPLSCKGRYRGSEPNRGDVDDSLGNFTLTLIDTLDTLAVMGDLPEFEKASRLVIENTKFDTDVVVSVFETNIRVLGGLLGGHVFAAFLRRKKLAMDWYKDEMLTMAKDIGKRLLPAFGTSTGIPYPKINLRHGISTEIAQNYKDTCTSCAGTMILEFAALSRFTGDPVFEDKAHKAMDYLWNQRHRQSDLVGTVINVHNGEWIRRESGVGAGIDSYYEYVLKAYILLGDDTYLTRFNRHYEAVMKYVSQGPRFIDVHMHRPQAPSRNFMDALLAFWPGLQVLKGDIQPAIEMHEMLYQVMQKHNFLPEAFTSDFHIHWGHHPLRPEFVESTYFLYKATGDPYYMEVGQKVIENLDKLARVKCGFAAIKDVTKGTHDDQMDSYVLAETFKYLYLLYSEKSDLLFDIDDYIFTTEAHLLPLSLSRSNISTSPAMRLTREMYSHLQALEEESDVKNEYGESSHNTCANPQVKFKQAMNYAHDMRAGLKDIVGKASPQPGVPQQCASVGSSNRLKAADFVAGNRAQLQQLQNMGIKLITMSDGRIQLLHSATDALSPQLAEEGLLFMQEMIELSKTQPQDSNSEPMLIQFTTDPYKNTFLKAGPAQFGYDLKTRPSVKGILHVAQPYKVCEPVWNVESVRGKIAILERGNCMFIDKARHLQNAGAIGGIVIDHNGDSSAETNPLFAMSGDGKDDVYIPLVFLFHAEGVRLLDMWTKYPNLEVVLTSQLEQMNAKVPAGPSVPTANSFKNVAGSGSPGANQEESSASHSQSRVKRVFTLDPLRPIEDFKTKAVKSETEELEHIVSASAKYSETSADGLIYVQTLFDDTRQLFFRFDKLPGLELSEPNFSGIYEKVRYSLYKYTNFADLDKQSEYLTGVVKLIEAAYYGNNNINEEIQELFREMANELEIMPPDEDEEQEFEGEELNQEEEETEPVSGTGQSNEVVDSKTITISEDGSQETSYFMADGIQVKIKTKIVRPVHQGQERTGVEFTGDSYATEEDFEASQAADNGNYNKYKIPEKLAEVDKDIKENNEIEKDILNSINAELAENLKSVMAKTKSDIDNKQVKDSSISSADKIHVSSDEKTGKTLENVQIQTNSDRSSLSSEEASEEVTRQSLDSKQKSEKSSGKQEEHLNRKIDEL